MLAAHDCVGEAEACWRRAIDLRPELSPACENLAVALLAQERYDETSEQAAEAIRIDQNTVAGHGVLGQACPGQGDFANAVAELGASPVDR